MTILLSSIPFIVAIIAYFLDKKKHKKLFIEQIKNENFNRYSEYLVEIMALIVSEYNPDLNKEEKFDPSNKSLLLPLLKLFGHFDSLYSRKNLIGEFERGQISHELFVYWDETINLMMKENFYKNAWIHIKSADYYSQDFIDYMDQKLKS